MQRETSAQMRPSKPARRPTAGSPLPVRLAHVLLDINRAFERNAERSGEHPSLVTWANLLRVIPDEGISVTELAPAARVSRRVVQAWLRNPKQHCLEIDDLAPR